MKKQSVDEKAQFILGVGKAMHKRRIQLGLSQEELAYKAKMDRSFLSEIERGGRNFSIYTLKKIADALEIKIADILKVYEK